MKQKSDTLFKSIYYLEPLNILIIHIHSGKYCYFRGVFPTVCVRKQTQNQEIANREPYACQTLSTRVYAIRTEAENTSPCSLKSGKSIRKMKLAGAQCSHTTAASSCGARGGGSLTVTTTAAETPSEHDRQTALCDDDGPAPVTCTVYHSFPRSKFRTGIKAAISLQ